MKDQLFRVKPDIPFINEFIQFYGLSDITDTNLFEKQNLIEFKTVENINKVMKKLYEYDLPCKSKVFLSSIDEKKCITILRQLLKIHNYNVTTKEKCIKGEKFNFYQIIPYSNKKINTKKEQDRPIVLSFD